MRIEAFHDLDKALKLQPVARFERPRAVSQLIPARLRRPPLEGKHDDVALLLRRDTGDLTFESVLDTLQIVIEPAIAAPEVDDEHAVASECAGRGQVELSRGQLFDL